LSAYDKTISLQAKTEENELKIQNYLERLGKSVSSDLSDLLQENLEKGLNDRTVFEESLAKAERDLNTLQLQDKTTKEDLETTKDLFKKLYSNAPDEYEIRLKLRLSIRQLVEKIVLWSNGLMGNIVDQDIKTRKCSISTIEHFKKPYIEYFNHEIETHKNSENEGERLYARQCSYDLKDCYAEIEQHYKENTGRNARVIHIYFKTGSFKEICYDPAYGYYIYNHYSEEEEQKLKEDDKKLAKHIDECKGDLSSWTKIFMHVIYCSQ
jgi:hypothetical protein